MITPRYAAGLPGRVRRGERGTSALEFALVLPLLLAFVVGIIQFGFAFAQTASLANGARQGARYGVVNTFGGGRSCAEVVQQVRNEARSLSMTSTAIAVSVRRGATQAAADSAAPICGVTAGDAMAGGSTAPCAGAGPEHALYVTATHATRLELFPPLGRNITLTGRGTYRCEYS